MVKTDPTSCPICSGASAMSGNHRCQDYYDKLNQTAVYTYTTHTTAMPDKKPIEVTIPLSLLVEIYGMSVTLAETSISKQILKILKGI